MIQPIPIANRKPVCVRKTCRLRMIAILFLTTAIGVMATSAVARGQETEAPHAASPANSPPASQVSATPAPTPIPLAEVVTRAEAVSAKLDDVKTDLASDQVISTIERELPILVSEIDARLNENARIIDARPSLATLRDLQTEWNTLGENLPVWKEDLTARATKLEGELTDLAHIQLAWSQTLEQARQAATGPEVVLQTERRDPQSNVPPESLQRIEAVITAINQTTAEIESQRSRVLTLQNRVADQDKRINDSMAAIEQVRKQIMSRLFVKDAPAIWSAEVRSRGSVDLWLASQTSLANQWAELRAYAVRQWSSFVLHAISLCLLVMALYWARRRVQPWVAAEPSLEGVARVFRIPIATGLVLSILLGNWIYPHAPRMLTAIFGAAALLPTIVVLRQLIERHLFPVLNGLVIFYFVDQMRAVTTSLPVLSRLLFMAEMLGGLMFLAWLIRSAKLAKTSDEERVRVWKIVGIIARIGAAVFATAFLANAMGYVSIATLLGNALLVSAYVAVMLYALIRIADGLIMFVLRVRPLSLLGMVHRHRPLFRRRIQRFLRWLAILVWALFTLEQLSLRASIVNSIRAALAAPLEVGSLQVSLGNVAAFIITVWLAFLLSRFLRFLLEEDIYPRVNLARGIPYAISTMLHYVILLAGFLFAVAAMGIDMTKFTILAGAFGVGLGFGLQTIVNNFVSGLILLFERPVKVGDVVQLGQYSGDLRRIGLRASVLRTWEGSEVIVPNGELISKDVVNWTLSDQQRRIEINVGIAYGTDPERVIELLTKVAASHKDVMKDPAPQTLFVGFGDSALDFQLRAWTTRFDRWMNIKSELTVGVNTALRDAQISIPFPQRELHLQSVAREVLKATSAEGNGQTAAAVEKRKKP